MSSNAPHIALQRLYICLTGLGIGWLTGLSLSPVVGEVLASLLGLVGGVVAGANSLRKEVVDSPASLILPLDAAPIALLVAGIAIGAPLGILARTHAVFAPPNVPATSNERPAATEQRPEPIAYSTQADPKAGGLYDLRTSECSEFLAVEQQDQSLRELMQNAKSSWASALVKRTSDPNTLRLVVEVVCSQ